MFAKGSRYQAVPEGVFKRADREAVYKLLRSLPDRPASQQTHAVMQGDRLDLLADRYFDDPEQFWRICDANQALYPDDLTTELGRRLQIPQVTGG